MTGQSRPIILKSDSHFDDAASAFRRGGIIAYPTETFYGLGVDPFNKDAIASLFKLKGRSEASPVSIIIKDNEYLDKVAEEVPPVGKKLIEKFWPGPLTIIFKAKSSIPPELISHTGKIGVRVSSNPVCRKLVETIGSAITATSANPSGERPPVEAKEVLDYFNGSIDILIDGGKLAGRSGSTIVDITGKKAEIIREGEIPSEEILKEIRGF